MLLGMITDGLFEAYEATTIRLELDEIEIVVEDEIAVAIEVEEP